MKNRFLNGCIKNCRGNAHINMECKHISISRPFGAAQDSNLKIQDCKECYVVLIGFSDNLSRKLEH